MADETRLDRIERIQERNAVQIEQLTARFEITRVYLNQVSNQIEQMGKRIDQLTEVTKELVNLSLQDYRDGTNPAPKSPTLQEEMSERWAEPKA